MRDAAGVIFVVDSGDPTSMQWVDAWRARVARHCDPPARRVRLVLRALRTLRAMREAGAALTGCTDPQLDELAVLD